MGELLNSSEFKGTDAIVEIDSVSYEVGGSLILRDLTLSVQRGEVLVLLGESGCGKTTTLKLINGLITATSGEVRVRGAATNETDVIELRRSIGYVLQNGGLFPHLTVSENVELPLRIVGRNDDERGGDMLDLVGLSSKKFGHRFPHELSGGQRQRVGVARALITDPDILLLDEPFGALDAITRARLQTEFADLVRRLGKTAVFVTHDLHEAIRIGNRIALMDKGSIVLLETPAAFSRSDIPLVRAYLETIKIPMSETLIT
jgi:osmoprotectant transport system ATP-binding protein